MAIAEHFLDQYLEPLAEALTPEGGFHPASGLIFPKVWNVRKLLLPISLGRQL